MVRCILAAALVCSTSVASATLIPFERPAPAPIENYLPVYTTIVDAPSPVWIEAVYDPGYQPVLTGSGFWIRRDVATWITTWGEAFFASINLGPYRHDASVQLEIGTYYGAPYHLRLYRINGGPTKFALGVQFPEPAAWTTGLGALAALPLFRRRSV
ncbi:MAG: hypothetical protein DCC67_14135 [Planctomycetota bacterium]|nr:MAG: hypothetical protein DCC67_14135 [Planctomycetota bacterium]